MENDDYGGDWMILLLENITLKGLDLYYTLQQSRLTVQPIVLNDDGNLPTDFTSPYQFFCGTADEEGDYLYFNQLPVPKFWQITGTNTQAEIWDMSDLRGRIFYHTEMHNRYIKTVDWLDKKGKARLCDHYNRFGRRFAQTTLDEDEKPIIKRYFNNNGQEVILENVKTGTLLLMWQEKTHLFDRKIDFFYFYLVAAGLSGTSIWFNSLSIPLLISYYYEKAGTDVLFYQEEMGADIPGNLRLVLEGRGKRVKHVVVQDKRTYNRLCELLPEEYHERLSYLGYLYPVRRQNQNRKEALILTNSDQIEALELLVTNLPEIHFHIGALTTMSSKLTAFEASSNVSLYPNINATLAEQLYGHCDLYLDLNHGNEILSAVRRAYEENQLILAFDNTAHQPSLLAANGQIFSHEHPEEMLALLKNVEDYASLIVKQRKQSQEDSIENIRQVLEKWRIN